MVGAILYFRAFFFFVTNVRREEFEEIENNDALNQTEKLLSFRGAEQHFINIEHTQGIADRSVHPVRN